MRINMKSKKWLAVLAMAFTCHLSAFANDGALVLWHADGSKTNIELSQLPQVRFENNKVLVTSSVLNMEYDADDILRFTYEEAASEDAGLVDGIASVQGDRLLFHGVKSADQVSVYSVNGTRIPVSLSSVNGKQSLSLSSIPSGVYILKVNGKSCKFTKK